MKNRNIPFGYRYQNGVVTRHPTESAVFGQIVRSYLDGKSLLNISEDLNAGQVEYLPGVTGWNKARVMRLLEDKRYLGDSGYPALIDADTFALLQEKKHLRNLLKDTDRQADIFQITVPVRCPACGAEMSRRHDSRCKCTERWTCRDPNCKTLIKMSDCDLLTQITEILNRIIEYPELIHDDELSPIEPTAEQRKLENEIGRIQDTGAQEKETLQGKLLELVSLKYKSIPAGVGICYRLKADFEKSAPLTAFSAELFDRTVRAVHLREDGAIDLELLNGQRFGKE